MSEQDFSNLSRPIQSMPESIREVLEERELMDAYRGRRRISRMIICVDRRANDLKPKRSGWRRCWTNWSGGMCI